MQNFECHVNLDRYPSEAAVREIGRRHGWKVSFITGDSELDQGLAFLTRHAPTFEKMRDAMTLLVATLPSDCHVAREKIEQVWYDQKYGRPYVVDGKVL